VSASWTTVGVGNDRKQSAGSTAFATNQGGLRLNPPKKAPPWFASQEQCEAFLKLTAKDLGPTCLTATSIEVEHLDEEHRKEILSGHALVPTLRSICSTYAAPCGMFGKGIGYVDQSLVKWTIELWGSLSRSSRIIR
jgi:hypothetical protein